MKKLLLITLLFVTCRAAEHLTFLTNGIFVTIADLRAEEQHLLTIPIESSTTIKLPHASRVEVVTNDAPESVQCHFWLQWIVETNDTPRAVAEWTLSPTNRATTGLAFFDGSRVIALTRNPIMFETPPCNKEHLDTSDHAVTHYVSSNLVSFLVWRGRTNLNYLESIPITNLTSHWHYEKTQVWTK